MCGWGLVGGRGIRGGGVNMWGGGVLLMWWLPVMAHIYTDTV